MSQAKPKKGQLKALSFLQNETGKSVKGNTNFIHKLVIAPARRRALPSPCEPGALHRAFGCFLTLIIKVF